MTEKPEPDAASHTSGALTPAAAAPPAELLAPDTLLAGRFRIICFVAAGGMGEVYEADDLELNERVAIKTVRSQVADDERALERFRREIQLARRVTHPCVCRTYDVFRHHLPSGRQVTFLSMEFLRGETLSARIRRVGRLHPAEAMPIAVQIASALAAAHDAGIVHRDFKSANIVLVDSPRGPRAVVTDFGLARDTMAAAQSEGVMGTPAYMAPEQLEGRETSPATDVYALGLVLYEMVTGVRPFSSPPKVQSASGAAIRRLSDTEQDTSSTAHSPVASALRRLADAPQSPRHLVPDLPTPWEAAILRCLERDPKARFAGPLEVTQALAPADARLRQRRWILAALAVSIAAGGLLVGRLGHGVPVISTARRSVAVLGFRNLSGRVETAWLSTALSETLTVELASGQQLRAVPGETVARTKLELGLPDADSFTPFTLGRLKANLGSDLVVVGSYLAEPGGRLRVNLTVQDAAAGETVTTLSDTGRDSAVLELLGRIGAQLRRQMALGEASPADAGQAQASLPATPEAARAYAEGLGRLRLFDALAARERLEHAIALEPDFPLAHAALAEAWAALGYDARARDEAKRAFDLGGHLARGERLAVEGRYREAAREWPAAIQTYQALVRFFPDDLEHGLRLAAAQTAGARGREALTTIDALRHLAVPASEDPRIDLAEAQAAHALSDERRSREAAARAAQKGLAKGARLLVARARFQEAWALRILGDLNHAATACEQARATFAELGDRSGVARTGNLIATVRLAQGDLEGARAAAEEALAGSRLTGNRSTMAGALGHIASVLRQQGDLAQARARIEEALAVQREVGDRLEEAIALNKIGGVQEEQGDLDGARATYQQALGIRPEIGDRRGEAYDRAGLGRLRLLQGEPAAAQELLDQSLRIRREIGQRAGMADSLHALGDLALARGDLATAHQHHQEALAIRSAVSTGQIPDTQLALAVLALEAGYPAEAIDLARPAQEALARAHRPDDAAVASTVLARGFLQQGRTAEARQAIAAAQERAAHSERLTLRLGAALTAADLEAAAGNSKLARQAFEGVLAQAQRRRHVAFALEAQLGLASLEGAAGASRRESVLREARRCGLLLIAERAARPR